MKKIAVNTAQKSKNKLVRRASGLMALEQRFMFDGAAVDTAHDVFVDSQEASPVQAVSADLFKLPAGVIDLAPIAQQTQAQIRSYLDKASDAELFALFNGGKTTPDADWSNRLGTLKEALNQGSLQLNLVAMDSSSVFTAFAAYTREGPNGEPTVFINRNWFNMFDTADAVRALAEELGHAVDDYLNPNSDTAGDEGQDFAAAVLGSAPSDGFANGRETGQVVANGVSYEVEFASFNFTTAYQIVVDINSSTSISGGIDSRLTGTNNTTASNGDNTANQTYEYNIDKESNAHNFIYTSTGLGAVTINDGANGVNFSGNDISAIGLNIGGTDYYGWISRPMKVGGQVKGFYFWTDLGATAGSKAAFTSLAVAQADGNQDGDAVTYDNRAFVLVVDKNYFDSTLGYVSESGVTGTTYKKIGSSSDRVDSALNSLTPSNISPVAVSDTTGTTLGSVSAREEGYNTNTTAVVTAAVAASGNVLTNDTDSADAITDVLVVTNVVSTSGTSSAVAASGNTTLLGHYGTLTINAAGAYSYVANDANSTVNALLTGSVNDEFTYSISDGNGGVASANLTIVINGSNDAPVAANDYNIAKEITTTSNSGFTATGNVLPNDSDVDNGDTKAINGLQINGSATIGTVTITDGTATLNFTGDNGFTSVGTNQKLYVQIGGVYRAVYASDGTTQVSVSSKLEDPSGSNNWVITLTASPSFYYNSTGNLPIASSTSFFNTNTSVLFENSTTSTENSSGGKTATVAVSGSTGYTTLTNVSGISGTIAVGMTVSGPSITETTKVSEITYSGGVLSSIKLDKVLTSSTSGSYTFSASGTLGQSLQGAHGTLSLASDGGYTYTPTTDNAMLSAGQSALEVFDYTMRDTAGLTSSAKLYITVYGSGTNDPVPTNDAGTATESGVTTGGNTATSGSDATGTVLSNDKESAAANANVIGTAYVNRVGLQGAGTYTTIDTATNGRTTQQSGTVTGAYGTLTIDDLGVYTYVVANGNATVNALLPGQTLTETFEYEVKNTLSSSGPSWAKLVITVQGTNDRPVAVADTGAVTEDQILTATGNVLTNDTDVDAGDTKVVSKVNAGNLTPTSSVDANTTSVNGLPVAGIYGDLKIGADGTYTYTLATSGAQYTALQALAPNTTQNEIFSYEVKDTNSATHTNTLTIVVTGTNEAPINKFNGTAISSTSTTSVITAVNTAIDFTGTKLLNVADVDTNLTSIILTVEKGVLSFTSTPSNVTLSVNSGSSIQISAGTQDQLNAALALLRYTPDNNVYGTDFLTIMSTDGLNAFDSDSIAINIPTNTAVTVSERALSSGSTPALTTETATGNLTLAGLSVLTQQTGNIRDGSNNIIGTWQVNTDGTFSVTLTAASSATSTTFSYVAHDSFGNPVSNTVTVSITDDVPTATANTNAVNEGSTATGNVLTNGVADSFGADGAKVTAPVGGVVGVRAAGSDTTTAVTTGLNTAITGLYGTLTLNPDGSYSYAANSNSVTSAQNDVFVYTIEDGDGSRSTATLTITVNDVATDTISVTGQGPVNEASPYAMFTVVASGTQTINLSVTNGTATLTTPSIAYSIDGTSWTTYTWDGSAGNRPTGGTFYVRVGITSEVDTIYEGSETFSLVATNSSISAITDTDSTSIIDDGTGTKYGPNATDTSTASLDNDKPTLTISDATVEEGSTLSFAATLSNASATAEVITLSAALGTAEAEDFAADKTSWTVVYSGGTLSVDANGSFTLPAGVTSFTIKIPSTTDNVYEGAETLTLSANATSAYITDSDTAGGTITDDGTGVDGDDADGTVDNDKPTLTISDATVEEGSTLSFAATLSNASATAEVITLSAALGTAEAEDFAADKTSWTVVYSGGTLSVDANGSFTLPAGVTSFTIKIPSTTDNVYEGAETLTLSANATSAYITDSDTAGGTITDDGTGVDGDDADGTVDNDKPTLTISDATVEEGSTLSFAATLSNASATAEVITLSAALGTAEAEDFAADKTSWTVVYSGGTLSVDANGSFTLPAGVTSFTIKIPSTTDNVYEGAETLTLSANATSAYITDSDTAGGTITDDGTGVDGDDAGNTTVDNDKPTLTISDATVEEGSTLSFAATLSNASATAEVITLSAALGTAEAEDFAADKTSWTVVYSGGTLSVDANGSFTLPAGVTSFTIKIPSTTDNVYEGAETLTLSANATSAYITDSDTAGGTITDDGTGVDGDDAGNTTVDDDRGITVSGLDDVSEGSNAVFTVTLPDGNTRNTEISLTLSDVSTEAEDYNASFTAYYYVGETKTALSISSGKITLPAGVTTFYVSVASSQDTVLEGAESLKLTATITGGKSAEDTSTIVDDGSGKVYDDKGLPDPNGVPDDDRPKPPPIILLPEPPAPIAPKPEATLPDPVKPPVQTFASEVQPLAPRLVPVEPPAPIGDVLTSSSGFRVVVNETASPGLAVFRGITDQFVEANGSSAKVSLPFDAFIHSNKEAVIKLDAKQADNSPLPTWVRFDPATGSFEVNPPREFKGKVDLKVVALDDDGREAVAIFQLFVGDKPAEQKPQSRNSLTEKLRLAGQRPVTLIKLGGDATRPVMEREVAKRAVAAQRASSG